MIDVLHDHPAVSLRRLTNRVRGVHGYAYAHESWCAGRVATVLPFRVVEIDGDVRLELLLCGDVVPSWDTSQVCLTAISGGWRKTDDLWCRETAIRALLEKSGYRIFPDDLIELQTSFASRALDTAHFIFSADLSARIQEDLPGRSCRWVPEEEVYDSPDPQVHVAVNRLRRWFFEYLKNEE